MPAKQVQVTITPEEQAKWETTKEFRKQLAALQKPVLARWLLALARTLLVIAAIMFVAIKIDHIAAYIVAILLLGPLAHALAVLGHEGAHRLICRNRKLNDFLGQFFGYWPILGDMTAYKEFHLGHHKHLNTPIDPELQYRRKGAPEWDLPRSKRSFLVRYLKDLFGLGVMEVYRIYFFMGAQTRSAILGVLSWIGIWVSIVLLTGHLSILVMWYGALFTSFVMSFRFRCWLEHMDADDTHRVHLPPWVAWLGAPHNIWVHYEHHKWCSIPYYNLRKARELDTSVSVMSLGELYQFYTQAPPLKSGDLSERQKTHLKPSRPVSPPPRKRRNTA